MSGMESVGFRLSGMWDMVSLSPKSCSEKGWRSTDNFYGWLSRRELELGPPLDIQLPCS